MIVSFDLVLVALSVAEYHGRRELFRGEAGITLNLDSLESYAQPSTRTGRWLALDVVTPRDLDFLYRLCVDESLSFYWRFPNGLPDFNSFAKELSSGSRAQVVVRRSLDRTAVGIATLYKVSSQHGYGYMAIALDTAFQFSGLGAEAIELFITFIFMTVNLRVLYIETPNSRLRLLRRLIGPVFQVEGTLKDYVFCDGCWQDAVVLSCWRESVNSIGKDWYKLPNEHLGYRAV